MTEQRAENLNQLPQTISFTNEQFMQLMGTFQRLPSTEQQQQPVPAVVPAVNGNFVHCKSRFDGKEESDVNAFIEAVETYKECSNVTDDNAFKGLSTLLDGFAARWWQGVKQLASTWEEAISSFRSAFGPKKPAHRVFLELFQQKQDEYTRTDVFICKVRAILSHLPNNTL